MDGMGYIWKVMELLLDPQINQGVRQKTDAPSGKYGRQGAPVRWENPRLDLRLGVGMFTQTMG